MEETFGHVRNNGLQSSVYVRDLFLVNKGLLALSVVEEVVYNSPWLNKTGDVYINYTSDKLAILNNLTLDHCGDCTAIPATCQVCLFESYYLEALELLATYNKIVGDEFPKYNRITLIMTIMQLAEKYWLKYTENITQPMTEYDENSLFEEFKNLSELKQDLKYTRMDNLRDYIETNF